MIYLCPNCKSTRVFHNGNGAYSCDSCGATDIIQYDLDTANDPPKGLKHDKGKLRYSLIPPIALKALASILTFGADKYAPNNWQLIDSPVERYTDALYRHLEAWRAGEHTDSESGKPHLWHAFTCLAFLIYFTSKDTNGTTSANSSKNTD